MTTQRDILQGKLQQVLTQSKDLLTLFAELDDTSVQDVIDAMAKRQQTLDGLTQDIEITHLTAEHRSLIQSIQDCDAQIIEACKSGRQNSFSELKKLRDFMQNQAE